MGHAERADAERYYHLAVSRLNEQHSRLSTIKLLPGVLADEGNYIGKGIDKRLLNIFPQSGQILLILFLYLMTVTLSVILNLLLMHSSLYLIP